MACLSFPGVGRWGLHSPFRRIVLVGAGAGFATRGGVPPEGKRTGEATASELGACMVQYLGTDATGVTSGRLARAFGMSERSYRRHLAVLDTSHRRLLENARLETAFRMLAEPAPNVTEIAYALGYADPAHFTRFFKQRVGLPPSEYRRASIESRQSFGVPVPV